MAKECEGRPISEMQGIYAKRIVAYGDILGWKEACGVESALLEKAKKSSSSSL
jgi:hypothetical protein